MKLDKLYEFADDKGIDIKDYRFSETKKAMCVHIDDYKSIAIDFKEVTSKAEETVILAEELGHYETGALYTIDATFNTPICASNVIYCEGRAKKWKMKKLLPSEELREAVNSGYTEIYELAEYFDLPEDFIEETVNYYYENNIIDFNQDW